jgi:hypothetical protein
METRSVASTVHRTLSKPGAIDSSPSITSVQPLFLCLSDASSSLQPLDESAAIVPATPLSDSESTPRAGTPPHESTLPVGRSPLRAASSASRALGDANPAAPSLSLPLSLSLSLDAADANQEQVSAATVNRPCDALAALQTSSTVALRAVMESGKLPAFAVATLTACRWTRVADETARAQFALAAVVAVRVQCGPTNLLYHTPAELAAADSEVNILPGCALPDTALRSLMRELQLPPSQIQRFTHAAQKVPIDNALRVLLRSLHSDSPECDAVRAVLHVFVDAALHLTPGTTAAAASASVAPVAAPPRVHVLPISGLAEQCFFRAAGLALDYTARPHSKQAGLQRWAALAKHIKDALDSIHSAPQLHYYGLPDVQPNSTQMQVACAKERYLHSIHFAEQRWGGTLEMYLLSHHFKGALGFLVLSPDADAGLDAHVVCAERCDGAHPPTPPLSSAHPYCPASGSVRPDREIAMHHCSSSGIAGGKHNHWELIQYQHPSSAVPPMLILDRLQSESASSRRLRLTALLHACKAAARRNAQAAVFRMAVDRTAAEELDRTLNGGHSS